MRPRFCQIRGTAMKWYHHLLGILAIGAIFFLFFSSQDNESISGDYFYAITSAGVLCAYSVVDTSLVDIDGNQMMFLENNAFSMSKVLGMDVDSRVRIVYHVDPKTGQFLFQDLNVQTGQNNFKSKIRVENDRAHCSSTLGGGDRVVDLPAGTLLENSLFYKYILNDFEDPDVEDKLYEVFDISDQEIQSVRYSRDGQEIIELDGIEYSTFTFLRSNLVNGAKIKMWLESSTGLCVKILENEGRVIFLADSSLAKDIKRFNMDDYILTKTNVSIADISGVDYMKVRAKINPIGLIVTPESLNVPGQKFEGVVEDNLIEGVFEIEYPRYDGNNAPAFPPNFSDDPNLAEYISPSKLIESDDPGIINKAQELTQGSTNSWEAMKQLSSWVATEIAYTIPGGGSAKGVFETKAGECGGHSVLLAAFCRSLGIPARMVWGVIYTPSEGGIFGQHGWNEIYMGDAGWIPVDATAHEIDYLDSGHIRLGTYESFATGANSKEYEILDYRVAGVTPEIAAAAAVKYQAYLGQYELP